MINITQGNDFALKIGFTKDGEKYEFDKVNGVLMVSRRAGRCSSGAWR